MRRTGWFIAYSLAGLLVSWMAARVTQTVVDAHAWSLSIGRAGRCWDIEHCRVPWYGYAVFIATVIGPAIIWGCTGARLATSQIRHSTLAASVALLAATVFFYLLLSMLM